MGLVVPANSDLVPLGLDLRPSTFLFSLILIFFFFFLFLSVSLLSPLLSLLFQVCVHTIDMFLV